MTQDESNIEESEGFTLEASRKKLLDSVRFILWMCVVLAVLLVGSFIRTYTTQNQLDKMDDVIVRLDESVHLAEQASIESKDNAKEALDTLKNIIRQIEESNASQPSLTNQAILDALAAINRIEARLCGGPCD